jgi:hypothetical protein
LFRRTRERRGAYEGQVRRDCLECLDEPGEDLVGDVSAGQGDRDGELGDTFAQPHHPRTVAGPMIVSISNALAHCAHEPLPVGH